MPSLSTILAIGLALLSLFFAAAGVIYVVDWLDYHDSREPLIFGFVLIAAGVLSALLAVAKIIRR